MPIRPLPKDEETPVAVDPLPSGGSPDDVLTRTADGAIWAPAPDPLPEGGEPAEILTKTADGADWAPPEITRTDQIFYSSSGVALDVKATPDTIDEEFNGQLDDTKWVMVSGAPTYAPVQFLGAPSNRLDVVTKPSRLLLQNGGGAAGAIRMRKPINLPDGKSIVAKMHPAPNFKGTRINDEYSLAFFLNNSTVNTSYLADRAGTYAYMGTDGYVFYGWAGQAGQAVPGSASAMATFWARVSRVGNTYYSSYSLDGDVWIHITSGTMAVPPTQLWIECVSGRTGAPYPISEIEYIRLGTNDLRPWT